jgi:hypothetical protein
MSSPKKSVRKQKVSSKNNLNVPQNTLSLLDKDKVNGLLEKYPNVRNLSCIYCGYFNEADSPCTCEKGLRVFIDKDMFCHDVYPPCYAFVFYLEMPQTCLNCDHYGIKISSSEGHSYHCFRTGIFMGSKPTKEHPSINPCQCSYLGKTHGEVIELERQERNDKFKFEKWKREGEAYIAFKRIWNTLRD